eukprot:178546_1
MGLLVVILDILLVLHHHLHLLVRFMMIIVMEIVQVAKQDIFGYSVSIAPPFAIIGAYWDDNSNGIDAGCAYIYENNNNRSWNEVSKLLASDGAGGDKFGYSVSIAPPFAIIGAYWDDNSVYDDNSNGNSAGSAYIMELMQVVHIYMKMIITDHGMKLVNY